MSLLLLFAYPNPASVPISELVTTAPSASNGYAIQIPASAGEWRWVVELADPSDGFTALWRDITGYYAGDRHQFGADTYLGAARARLIAVQLQIDDSDMLAPWGQDTSSIFGVDVRLDSGMLMRAGFTRIVSGVVEEWLPAWTGRVERWGDESAAVGQVRRHIVNVVDTMSDLANVPVQFDDSAANWPEYFDDYVLTPANWLFGVDMYGDESPATGFAGDEALTAAINRMDNGVAPLGFVWRSLRNGKLVIHPAPWNTTSVERYANPLLDVYPDGVRFNYSPDFTDVDYIADDDQQPFGIERTVDGILNYFVVSWPDGFDTATYATDDPVSIGRYGVRPFSASWIREGVAAVDDLLAARAFASAQALPLRSAIDQEGFWPAMAMLDHMDPVTVIHATSPEGLVVTGTGTVRNIVEERTFRGEAGGDYALSWQSTVQIDLDATETSAALLPVEDLMLVSTESPLLGTSSWAEFSWTNPTQPDITPTEVQLRVLGRSLIWMSEDYPGVGADGSTIGALDPATSYVLQVRLVRRVNGVIVAASVIRSLPFTTPALIYPTPVPGDDPTDTNVDMDDVPFGECEDVSIELQEQEEIGGAWVTVDTFSGAEIILVDGVWHLVDDIPNSFFNEGSMYRFVGLCDGDVVLVGGGFDPPDDWDDPCTTPPALSDPPFDDPSLLVYVPMVCGPDTIKEAVSGLVATHGPALDGIGSLLDDPNSRALLAIPDPGWSDAPAGILAYGECPQIVGFVADKTVTVKANVADAAYCVLFECAAMRITCTPSGAGWKAGAYVAAVGGEQVCLSAELDLDTVYVLTATYDQPTGTLSLYVDGDFSNSVSFGEERNTVAALPIWRVGAPPESWITDAALFGTILTPSFDNEVVYNHTGAAQTFNVPSGVTLIEVEYWGAGATSSASGTGGVGGKGGYLLAHHTVTPLEVLQVNVGGSGSGVTGGYNGGGTSGGAGSSSGRGGAGASDIRRGAYGLANRLGVAGAGGGAGAGFPNGRANSDGGNGNGDGNGTAGAAGVTSPSGGGAGTGVAGGAGGVGDNNWGDGNGDAGVLGVGGDSSDYHAGGGGGGIYGGGGGGGGLGASAGGGGSGGVLDGGTILASDIGVRIGHGQITIRYS